MMASMPSEAWWLLDRFGCSAVGLAIGSESMGVPFPGEGTLDRRRGLRGCVASPGSPGRRRCAAIGAIIGDDLGLWIGRAVGTRLTVRYGARPRITERRLRLGRYLFVRHGGKVVLFGRFVTMLRALAALLAGVSDMGWEHPLTLNVASGVL